MSPNRAFALFTLTVVILSHHSIDCGSVKSMNGRKVVLMSMDGFRHDYLTKTDTPHFDALIASGVKVPYVNNTFATWTFPCHYTIVTGLYEESHGIIANAMFDPVLNKKFTKKNHETEWWNGGVPIWINAVKSGRKTGVFFWPGSEAEVEGHRPTKWKSYNASVAFKERVDTVISEWLVKDDFDFGVLYFHEPDHTGHIDGPESPQLIKTVKMMDGIVGYFMQKLKEEKLTDKVDVILTSDHGMTTLDETTRVVILEDHVNDTLLKDVVIDGAAAHLIPTPGNAKALADALRNIAHVSVYLKEDIPDHYFYKHNRRIMKVIVIADEGWTVRKDNASVETELGGHGYSNDLLSMKPIFMATGPSFKKGLVSAPIKSVDIYPLLCHLLNIHPAPNNGSFHRVAGFLHSGAQTNAPSSIATLCFTVAMSICSSMILSISW